MRAALLLQRAHPEYYKVLNILIAAGVIVDVVAQDQSAGETPIHMNLRVHTTVRSMDDVLGAANFAICHGRASEVHQLVYLGVPVAAFPIETCEHALCQKLLSTEIGWVREAGSQNPVDAFVERILTEATQKKRKVEAFRRGHPPANAWVLGQKILVTHVYEVRSDLRYSVSA